MSDNHNVSTKGPWQDGLAEVLICSKLWTYELRSQLKNTTTL